MLPRLAVAKDKKRLGKTIKTFSDVIADKTVTKSRMKAAQGFLLSMLEEINSKRPRSPIRCGGNVLEQE